MTQAIRATGWLLAFAGLLTAGRPEAPVSNAAMEAVQRAHYLMGTIFEITAYGRDREDTAAAIEDAFSAIREADEILSHYKSGNELARLNATAALREVEVHPDIHALLKRSKRYSRLSGGAFDVTVSPLVRFWTRAAEEDRIPSESEIGEVLGRVGYGAVELPRDSRVRYRREGIEVQFGAIGKGWAVDQAVARLKRHGVQDAFVSAGGSTVYALGTGSDGRGWRVGIRDPRAGEESESAALCITNSALSTSGSYETYVEIAGHRYSHIIDPRNGWPTEPMLSATVISPDATESDALSTAVYVLGTSGGERLLRRLGIGGVLIGRAAGGGLAIRRLGEACTCPFEVGGGR